jgi:hypothetical protein
MRSSQSTNLRLDLGDDLIKQFQSDYHKSMRDEEVRSLTPDGGVENLANYCAPDAKSIDFRRKNKVGESSDEYRVTVERFSTLTFIQMRMLINTKD